MKSFHFFESSSNKTVPFSDKIANFKDVYSDIGCSVSYHHGINSFIGNSNAMKILGNIKYATLKGKKGLTSFS